MAALPSLNTEVYCYPGIVAAIGLAGKQYLVSLPSSSSPNRSVALALATWPPGRFNPNAKAAPTPCRPAPGQLPKPRRAGLGIGWVSTLIPRFNATSTSYPAYASIW